MIGIDLFSGAGGMSLGAEQANVKVKLAVEWNYAAARTYMHNHPKTLMLQKDIRSLKELPSIENPENEPVVVFGGPPCQGFSTSNQRTRSLDNPNNWLYKEYMRIVSQILPDWVVFENVTGILETEKGLFVEQILADFAGLGYTVSIYVLNSKDYGVPQNRRRFFAIASKHSIKVSQPEKQPVSITVGEAVADLPVLEPGASTCRLPYATKATSHYAKRLRGKLRFSHNHLVTFNNRTVLERYAHIPQGGNWEDIPKTLMGNYKDKARCHTGIYRRLVNDDVSVVIGNYRKNMLIHPTQNRGLSVREAARLQSFPDRFVFTGSIGFQQQQVGNAVPPLLAQAVFSSLSALQ